MNDYGVMNRPSQVSYSFQRKNTDMKTESLKNMSKLLHVNKYIATLFTIAKTWKQVRCPSVDK